MGARRRSPLKSKSGNHDNDFLGLGLAEDWMQSLLSGGVVVDERDAGNHSQARGRILLMVAGLMIVFVVLFVRLFTMQVMSSDQYSAQASGNRIREIVEYAPRGRIFDRGNKVLADNTLSFQLSAVPYLTDRDSNERAADLQRIAKILDRPASELASLLNAKGLEFTEPVVVAERITHSQALKLSASIPKLDGFSLDEIPIRTYERRGALSHIIGYTGRVSEADLENDQTEKLLLTDYVGKDGIEKTYDEILRGTNGWQRIEVDALGRPVRILGKQAPRPGQDIHLTIDFKTQKGLTDALRQEMKRAKVRKASSVAVDPRDGSVIAMVSLPSYDNNLFAKGISTKDFNRLVNNPDQPLLNKSIAGGYVTGSIIKPLVAAAALQEGVVDQNTVIVDRGFIDVVSEYQPGAYFRFRGWNPAGLGPMTVRSAIAMSSNIYFFTAGGGHGGIDGLGEERLTHYYREFGLGSLSGIDIPGEIDGLVPDAEWKQANRGDSWYVGDTYNISIGQGDLIISPLQITMAEAVVANKGSLWEPYLLKGAEPTLRRELKIDDKNFTLVHEGMREVLTNGLTCECIFDQVPVKVAGKSGTSETDPDSGRRPHGWFTAFAPYNNPEMVITVFLEEGFNGTEFGAPVAARALELYFKR